MILWETYYLRYPPLWLMLSILLGKIYQLLFSINRAKNVEDKSLDQIVPWLKPKNKDEAPAKDKPQKSRIAAQLAKESR